MEKRTGEALAKGELLPADFFVRDRGHSGKQMLALAAVTIFISTATMGINEKLALSIEPIPRPQGFILIRGRLF